jgi:class 3 adenylate cyclase
VILVSQYQASLELTMERKLTAILSADVEGYSRLMGEDEEATIRTLTSYREAMDKSRSLEEVVRVYAQHLNKK